MILEIVTPRKVIKEENVEFVSMEGIDGSFGVLADHMPLLAQLKIAPLHYVKDNRTELVAVMGGVARVMSNVITIVTEDAEKAIEIDELKAKKEKEDAQAYLTKKAEIADIMKAEIQLRKALVKLRVAESSKRI
jgi:F-type H+-transporting ATPase subunit epsilon